MKLIVFFCYLENDVLFGLKSFGKSLEYLKTAVENETIKRYPLWGLQRGILKEVRVYVQLATEKETFSVRLGVG